MRRDLRVYIQDMIECIQKIQEYTDPISMSDFFSSTQIQDAVFRRLEIIGEAVKHVPKNFRSKHPEIPWREIAGLRDIFAHDYFGVNLSRTWKVIKEDIPDLKGQIIRIATEMDQENL